jgi:hypothetical protein
MEVNTSMTMVNSYRARVQRGRLILDEATGLPEGAVVEFHVADVATGALPRGERVATLARLVALFDVTMPRPRSPPSSSRTRGPDRCVHSAAPS